MQGPGGIRSTMYNMCWGTEKNKVLDSAWALRKGFLQIFSLKLYGFKISINLRSWLLMSRIYSNHTLPLYQDVNNELNKTFCIIKYDLFIQFWNLPYQFSFIDPTKQTHNYISMLFSSGHNLYPGYDVILISLSVLPILYQLDSVF